MIWKLLLILIFVIRPGPQPQPNQPIQNGCGIFANFTATSPQCKAINGAFAFIPILMIIMVVMAVIIMVVMAVIIMVVMAVLGIITKITTEEQPAVREQDESDNAGLLTRLLHWLFYRRRRREEESENQE